MPPITRPELERALDEAGPDAARAFVAALYERCGYDVTPLEGSRVRLDRDGRAEVLAVLPDGTPADGAPVDAVVAPDAGDLPADVRVVDAAALHRRLLYAVDREACAALVADHLGRPLSSFEGADGTHDIPDTPAAATPPAGGTEPDSTGGTARSHTAADTGAAALDPDGAGGDATVGPPPDGAEPTGGAAIGPASGGPAPSRSPRWLAGGAVALLAVAAVVLVTGGVPAAFGGGDATAVLGSGSVPAAATPTATPEDGSDIVGAPLSLPTERPDAAARDDPGFSDLPPGVDATGAIDERQVASAHARYLSNRSYRIELVHREFVDGRPVGVHREVVAVGNATTYAARTTTAGRLSTAPLRLVDGDVYANGTALFERPGGENATVGVEPLDARARSPPDRLRQYLVWYLSVRESRIAGTTTRGGVVAYWLTVDGDPYVGVANTTGSTLVDRNGVVREVRRAYDVPGRPSVSVVVTIRVTGVNETAVEPPRWVDGA